MRLSGGGAGEQRRGGQEGARRVVLGQPEPAVLRVDLPEAAGRVDRQRVAAVGGIKFVADFEWRVGLRAGSESVDREIDRGAGRAQVRAVGVDDVDMELIGRTGLQLAHRREGLAGEGREERGRSLQARPLAVAQSHMHVPAGPRRVAVGRPGDRQRVGGAARHGHGHGRVHDPDDGDAGDPGWEHLLDPARGVDGSRGEDIGARTGVDGRRGLQRPRAGSRRRHEGLGGDVDRPVPEPAVG